MFLISSLFVLLFRISMAFHGQVEVLADAVQQEFFASQGTQETAEQQIRNASGSFSSSGSLAPGIEIEEKVEVESEESAGDLHQFTFAFDYQASKAVATALYSNKAIRGSSLPLYDFFHSWKFHLS
jgi:hypothetical protein